MKHFTKFTFVVLLFSILMSCKKQNEYSYESDAQQQLIEGKEVLLTNEFLETEGIRFSLNYSLNDAQIVLKLYKGTGTAQSPITLIEENQFTDYSVLANQLEENSEFILVVEYNAVTNNGSFDLSVIGYTSLYGTNQFTLSNNSFTTTNAGTKKDFLRIKKGINKYSFFQL